MAYDVVSGSISNHLLGTTTVADPIVMLKIDGAVHACSYVVQRLGASTRYVYPRVVMVNGINNVYLTAISQIYGTDLPSITKSITVYVSE